MWRQLQLWALLLMAHVATARERARHDERGAIEITTTVILTAILGAGAITVAGIIIAKMTGAAENIPTP